MVCPRWTLRLKLPITQRQVVGGHSGFERRVRDTDTGLTWQGCAAGKSGDNCDVGSESMMNWQAALLYCEDLDWGSYDDWHLPDRNELQSIVDYDSHSPSIDTTAFPGRLTTRFGRRRPMSSIRSPRGMWTSAGATYSSTAGTTRFMRAVCEEGRDPPSLRRSYGEIFGYWMI
jgi:uncharacterized protein DUF1566